MAKRCMIDRENKRKKLSIKYQEIRKTLRIVLKNKDASLEEKEIAQAKLQRIPRDSNICRGHKRCWMTGRSKGVYRKVGLCRNMFRVYAMQGDIPGLHKASW